jgi:hypothetical protein
MTSLGPSRNPSSCIERKRKRQEMR